MARKRKRGGVGAVCSAKFKFFHPSAPLRDKMGEAVVNRERFNGLTIVGECRRVFSRRSRTECDGYECTHPDFPGVTFQVAKNHVRVEQEGEMPFEGEVEPNVPPEAEAPTVLMAAQEGNTDENGELALRQSVFNADASINSDLVRNVSLFRGNLGTADISELRALGLEVENEDPLPENRANVGTMHHAAEAVGNWVNPIVCP